MAKQRILVVDDDPSIRRTLEAGLGKAGYEVSQAGDGEEAIQLLRKAGVDLVIADVYMPKKSGLQVLRDLREHSLATPVIVMTDGGRTKNFNPLNYSEVLGAAETIAKPFTLEQMLSMVRQVLGEPARE